MLDDDFAEEGKLLAAAGEAYGKAKSLMEFDLAVALYAILADDQVILNRLDSQTVETANGIVQIGLSILEEIADVDDNMKGRAVGFVLWQTSLALATPAARELGVLHQPSREGPESPDRRTSGP